MRATVRSSNLFILLAGLAYGQSDVAEMPAFTASPTALQQSFGGLQAGSDSATILLEEARFEFDSVKRRTLRHRIILKVWTKEGADGWSMIQRDWSPWKEERPVVRARVIAPDGSLHELDPSTIADSPVRDVDPDVFSDRRMIRAPLPAIEPGSVIEEEVVEHQTAATLDVGDVGYFYFGSSVPVERTRITLAGAESIPLRFKAVMLPHLAVREHVENGLHQIEMEQGPMKPLEDPAPLLPSTEPRQPHIVFSTVRDWQSVAAAYSAVVEKQIKGFNASSVIPNFSNGSTRDAKILAIVQKLNREIRYTGIEFGEASVVPRTPAEVLQHKYGDCKDKASLAVAMLRAAGIEAHIALLLSDAGEDIDPDLPGMDLFNHAIVYAPGSPDYWLDLTDPNLRLGVMAPENQGRMSLIGRPESTKLVRTPEATADANRIIETREFILPERGRAKVIETSETFGPSDREYRGAFGSRNDKELRDQLKSYVETTYAEAKIAKITPGNPEDLSKPFTLRIELDDAQRGTVVRTEAAVGIFISQIAQQLPGFFQTDPKNSKEKNDTVTSSAPRTADFEISDPFTYEWHYRITAAPGFRVRQLPEPTRETVGLATLDTKFTKVSETQVSADLRFVVPKRRFSAAEGLALRDAVVELDKRKPMLIYFDEIGETELAVGMVREALSEFNQLRKLHPTEALHSLQYARALLAAGAGQSARAEAHRGIELEPKSVDAYIQMAEILKSDLIGRPYAKGMDRDAAIDAYKKALELDPKDAEARANLAILLEYNSSGVRYGSGARLDEAVAEYQEILEKLPSLRVAQNYPIALLRAGRMQELREYLRKQPDNETNQTLSICAEAILNGSKAAADRAGNIPGITEKQRVLASAAQTLITIRHYDLAAELLEAASSAAQSPAAVAGVVQMLRKAKPIDDFSSVTRAPEDAVRILMQRIATLDRHEKDWSDTLSALVKDESTMNIETVRQGLAASLAQNQAAGLDPAVIADLLTSTMQFSREGDDEKGYIVRLTLPGMMSSGSQSLEFLVSKEQGGYRIVGTPGAPGSIGLLALNLADTGKLEQAGLWLDRVRRALPAGGGDDPLSGTLFSRLWQLNSPAPRTAAQIRRAAATLLVADASTGLANSVRILEEASAQGGNSVISAALIQAYLRSKQYEKAVPLAKALFKDLPQSPIAFSLVVRSAYAAGGVPEGRRALDANLMQFEQDVDTLRNVAGIAMMFGDAERSNAINKQIIDSGRATPFDYNQMAWGDLMLDKVTADSANAANQGILLMGNTPATPLMHTLAAIDAELGKESDARAVMLQRLKIEGTAEPGDDDWYVFGRIAEQYGLTQDAAGMYRRLRRPTSDFVAASSYAMAQKRLKAMGLQ